MPESNSIHAHVLLGDVIASREIANRASFGETLQRALASVNDAHEEAILAPVAALKGIDEFAGVLRDRGAVYEVVRDLQSELHPEAARYAVVYGEIDVNPTVADVGAMDGPAFHRADALIGDLSTSESRFALETDGGRLDDSLTAAADLALALREEWTERQREVVRAYQERGTQVAVADELGVTRQAISRILKQARYGRVASAEKRIDRALAT